MDIERPGVHQRKGVNNLQIILFALSKPVTQVWVMGAITEMRIYTTLKTP
jgi:hypothetical protein